MRHKYYFIEIYNYCAILKNRLGYYMQNWIWLCWYIYVMKTHVMIIVYISFIDVVIDWFFESSSVENSLRQPFRNIAFIFCTQFHKMLTWLMLSNKPIIKLRGSLCAAFYVRLWIYLHYLMSWKQALFVTFSIAKRPISTFSC